MARSTKSSGVSSRQSGSEIVYPWEVPDLLLGAYLQRHQHRKSDKLKLKSDGCSVCVTIWTRQSIEAEANALRRSPDGMLYSTR